MSGGMFLPTSHSEGAASLAHAERHGLDQPMNPLLCYLCHQAYREPCLLACYHTFCAWCLRGRSTDGKLPCPICGKVTSLRDGHSLPPSDSLLRFLVESSSEEFPSCANCERNEKTPMFFCNTCGQALCGPCRDETHRAKMFSQHDVIHMSKKTKELHRKCSLHNEPFTMFCTTKKTMLCIKCFRDTSMDARLHCVDLDTAYNQGTKKLERALGSIRELQSSLRDGVILFRALLEELRRNMDSERKGVVSTYDALHDAIKKTYDILLTNLDTKYLSTDQQLRSQLDSLGTMLPTVQMHLIMCTTFSSTANKYEFLTMAYQLIDRLTALAHLTYPLRPGNSCDMNTDYKVKFVGCLEPVLGALQGADQHSSLPRPPTPTPVQAPTTATTSKSLPGTPKHKTIPRIELSTEFPEHCKMFDSQMKVLNKRFGNIKGAVSDLHRDVTTRRCLTSYDRVESIVHECAIIKTELEKADGLMGGHKAEFDKKWEIEQLRIKSEQVVFNDQVLELSSLRSELRQLMVIAQSLEPYIRSISAVMERIQPQVGAGQEEEVEERCHERGKREGGQDEGERRRQDEGERRRQDEGEPEERHQERVRERTQQPQEGQRDQRGGQDERLHAILERIQIMQPDYKQRVEAIQRVQEAVGQQRKSSMSPFEESILQQKQLLRTSSRDGFLAHQKKEEPTRDDEGGAQGNGVLPAMWTATAKQELPKPPREPPRKCLSEKEQDPVLDFDIPPPLTEPPMEYMANDPHRKSIGESNDAKRGILSSILEKVRSKEENKKSQITECLPFNSKDEHRKSQPLLENIMDCATFRSTKDDVRKSQESMDSVVQKPYEPPGMGKPSRVTPVGGEEVPPSSQSTGTASSCMETDSVEVLSVIRFNKSKVTANSTPTTLRSSSNSETNSIFSQMYGSCDVRPSKSDKSIDQEGRRSGGKGSSTRAAAISRHQRSRSSSRPAKEMETDYGRLEADDSSNMSAYLRRSSAPEIDHECAEEEEEQREKRRWKESSYTRSLERTKRSVTDSARSSDSEQTKIPDKKELQRAVAHLQETLQGKMEKMKKLEAEKQLNQSEIKAVVHRSEPQPITTGKTLDSDAIKQYQNIKQNTTAIKRSSGVFDMSKTGKGERHGHHRDSPGIHKQSSFDSLIRHEDIKPGVSNLGGGTTRESPLMHPELKKQDSFEGHEAAVRSLVEIVHESRKLEAAQRKKSEG